MNPYDKYLRYIHMPYSGRKDFKPGQIYTVNTEALGPYVFKVLKCCNNNEYFEIEILAGGSQVRDIFAIGNQSTWAVHSELVTDVPEPKVDWSKYLPTERLPDSGPKEFKVGQVWAYGFDESASIYEILGQDVHDGEGYWEAKTLAGQDHARYLHPDSYRSRHSRLIKYLPKDEVVEPQPTPSWDTLTNAQKADLISVASRARQQAIDEYIPRSGPLNSLPAITEAVVRAFSAIRDGGK